jgi:hypothetical protein
VILYNITLSWQYNIIAIFHFQARSYAMKKAIITYSIATVMIIPITIHVSMILKDAENLARIKMIANIISRIKIIGTSAINGASLNKTILPIAVAGMTGMAAGGTAAVFFLECTFMNAIIAIT